jgi:hypothetical protein
MFTLLFIPYRMQRCSAPGNMRFTSEQDRGFWQDRNSIELGLNINSMNKTMTKSIALCKHTPSIHLININSLNHNFEVLPKIKLSW